MKSIRNLCLAWAAAFSIFVLGAAPALAVPIPYSTVNIPADSPQALPIAIVAAVNGYAPFQGTVACSGTTTATCTGLKVQVSVTGLSTAATAVSAAMTVTDTSVTAASFVLCMANGYAGTGIPNPVNVIPAAGSFSFQIQNSAAAAALNATVAVSCMVFN